MYVIVRNDGMFVARLGSGCSYTNRLQNAQTYDSKEIADRNRCPENESVRCIRGYLL